MKQIALQVENVMKQIFSKKQHNNPLLTQIMTHWCKIIGIKLSNEIIPLKICITKEKNLEINILYIKILNYSSVLEIFFIQEAIIERINLYFNYKVIHKLKWKHC